MSLIESMSALTFFQHDHIFCVDLTSISRLVALCIDEMLKDLTATVFINYSLSVFKSYIDCVFFEIRDIRVLTEFDAFVDIFR